SRRQGGPAGMDRTRGDCAPLPALFHGPDRPVPGGAVAERGPPSHRDRAVVDRRYLWISACRIPDYDGQAGRPDRPSPAAPDRGCRVWRRLRARGVFDAPLDAHRCPGAARRGCGDAGPVDSVADSQHVPRPEAAHNGDCGVGASFSAGAAIGPPIGGLLLSHFWWGSVFLLAVPTMALLLVLGPLLLPEYRAPQPGRLDLTSAGMSVAAVLTVIYGLKEIARTGIGWLPALSILTGLAVAIAFVRRQRLLADPLIDLRLFRVRTFSLPLVANTLSLLAAFGASLFVAQYLQLVRGLSPWVAGWWAVPEAGALIVGSILAPLVVRRIRPAFAMAAGMVIAGVGFGIL